MSTAVLASVVDLNKKPYFIHWGVIQISASNLIVLGLMVAVFVLAVLLPFPKPASKRRKRP